MTVLTPTFAERIVVTNGAAPPPHVSAAHEPTREGEIPPLATVANPPVQPPLLVAQQPLKVALVGTAPSSRMLAPYNDPTWTIWGCSPGNMNTLPRIDVWFELHSNLLWPEHESYGRPYIEWLKQQSFPVYMQDQSLLPNARIFPMQELVAEFGMDFFTSSFAWQMALAIKMGASEIALYGIDMASRDEYILQRPGFYFFRHMAHQRGIKVSAPHESDIMQSPSLYAYVDSTPFGRKIRARTKEINDRIAPMVQQRDSLSNNITYLQGAKEDIDYFDSIWSGVSNEMSILKYDNAMLQQQNLQLKSQLVMLGAQVSPAPVAQAAVVAPKPKRRRLRKSMMPQPPPQPEPAASVMESPDGELLNH